MEKANHFAGAAAVQMVAPADFKVAARSSTQKNA
jgi:hypothetical protein